MADTILTNIYELKPIDWSGGYSLQQMSTRRADYIKALRAADKGDMQAFLDFIDT